MEKEINNVNSDIDKENKVKVQAVVQNKQFRSNNNLKVTGITKIHVETNNSILDKKCDLISLNTNKNYKSKNDLKNFTFNDWIEFYNNKEKKLDVNSNSNINNLNWTHRETIINFKDTDIVKKELEKQSKCKWIQKRNEENKGHYYKEYKCTFKTGCNAKLKIEEPKFLFNEEAPYISIYKKNNHNHFCNLNDTEFNEISQKNNDKFSDEVKNYLYELYDIGVEPRLILIQLVNKKAIEENDDTIINKNFKNLPSLKQIYNLTYYRSTSLLKDFLKKDVGSFTRFCEENKKLKEVDDLLILDYVVTKDNLMIIFSTKNLLKTTYDVLEADKKSLALLDGTWKTNNCGCPLLILSFKDLNHKLRACAFLLQYFESN